MVHYVNRERVKGIEIDRSVENTFLEMHDSMFISVWTHENSSSLERKYISRNNGYSGDEQEIMWMLAVEG